MNMKPKYPICEVEWQDAHCFTEWSYPEDVEKKSAIIHSVGYLLEEGEYTRIFQDISSEGKINNILCIPHSAVKKIRRLK